MFSSGEHAQLTELEFNQINYDGLEAVGDAYAATKFLSKFEGLTLGLDKGKAAIEKFMKFEDLCRSTNSRFRNLERDPLYKGPVVWLHDAVIRKISKLLPDVSTLSVIESILELADWGPGASTLIKSRNASSANKFQHEVGITRDCYALFNLESIRSFYPGWGEILREGPFPLFQVGNKVVAVPKDAKEDRIIAAEPGLNLWFQLGIGEFLKSCLKKGGVDLRYQSKNQEMARIGSLDGSLATIDLSSASDSIATELVRAIFPHDWFCLMDACRSHYGNLPTGLAKWNKFSSMGNGFTFPLETLIFFAASSACIEYLGLKSRAYVYGDDVVIPTECVELFSLLCEFYGFRINPKKSHVVASGFRESCGAHWYRGCDIKPVYLKGKLTTVPTLYRFGNAVRRFAHRRLARFGCDAKFLKVFRFLVSKVHKSSRFMIPEGWGDGGFIVNFDEATPTRARDGVEGYRFRHLSEVAKCNEVEYAGLLQARLKVVAQQGVQEIDPLRSRAALIEFISRTSGQPTRGNLNSIPLGRLTKLRISLSTVPRWYDLGPWI
jgi:hypothetical protein